MIFRTPDILIWRLCLCSLSFRVNINFQILYTRACPPPPVSFHLTHDLPFTPTKKRTPSVLHPQFPPACPWVFYLLFSLDFFFLPQAIRPAGTHRRPTKEARRHSQTHRSRESICCLLLHTPPAPTLTSRPRHPSLLNSPHPPLPSGHPPSHPFFFPSFLCSGLRPVPWESTSDHLARGASARGSEETNRKRYNQARFGGLQFRFFRRRPYCTALLSTVVCPRTPYRNDVLAPLSKLQLTPDPPRI